MLRANNAIDQPHPALWPSILAARPGDACYAIPADETPWRTLLAAAGMHRLDATLAVQCKRLGLLRTAPPAISQLLDRNHRAGVVAALAKQAVLQMTLDALGARGIVPVAYKGAALAFLRYPEPCMRPMGDIDLWVGVAEMPLAIAALAELGFRQHLHRKQRPLALQRSFEGEVQMRHPQHGLVELHWGVFPGEWLKRACVIDRAAVRGRLRESRLLGHPIRLLAPRDHLVQVALHATISGRLCTHALRSLLDVALLADDVEDWPALLHDIKRWRVARACGHAFAVAGVLFDRFTLLSAARQITNDCPIRLLLRHIDADAVLGRRRIAESWRGWTYLLCATDRRRDALRLIVHTLLPNKEWLLARYGHANPGDRIAHAWRAMRGAI